ncbi:MAG: lysophospholipid acyltransferase family protein [Planctomycetota bacterium]|nr:lysophospholipid acyltransferase family protein [Planctomycetota bacterium]
MGKSTIQPADGAMSLTFYRASRLMCRFIKFQCISETVLHADRAERPGGLLLAVTHLSHLEPIVVSAALERHVRWMARIEFYRSWWAGAMLRRGGAFPVDRFGYSLPAVRRAIELVRRGELVGIFPEGGVAKGAQSMMRGGPIKQGICTIALRTGVPIVPVVVLGTHELNRVGPWIPPRRGKLFVAFGRDVVPPPYRLGSPATNRAARHSLAMALRSEVERTYGELLAHAGLTDSDVP